MPGARHPYAVLVGSRGQHLCSAKETGFTRQILSQTQKPSPTTMNIGWGLRSSDRVVLVHGAQLLLASRRAASANHRIGAGPSNDIQTAVDTSPVFEFNYPLHAQTSGIALACLLAGLWHLYLADSGPARCLPRRVRSTAGGISKRAKKPLGLSSEQVEMLATNTVNAMGGHLPVYGQLRSNRCGTVK